MSPISQSKQPANHNRFAVLATVPSNYGLDTPITTNKKHHSHPHQAHKHLAQKHPEGFVHLHVPADSFVIVHTQKSAKNNSWTVLDKPNSPTPKKEGWLKRLLPGFLSQ